MRLNTLTVAGIGTFRTATEIDLSAPLFALTGPTGSGKTTLLDAIMLTLYGRVPRYGGRAISPVMTTGVDTASVTLTFSFDGRTFAAVRRLARTRSGATTKEARLIDETDPDNPVVLADDATGVSDQIEALLGLDADQFASTVLLPQGDYDKLLTGTPAKRQQLLIGLLGMEKWRDVGKAARSRADTAAGRAEYATAQLNSIGTFSADDVAAADARVTTLTAALTPMTGHADTHAAATAAAATLTADAAAAEQAATACASVDGFLPTADALTDPGPASTKAADLREDAKRARQAATDARAALDGVPTRDTFVLWRSQLDGITDAEKALAAATDGVGPARDKIGPAEQAVKTAKAALAAAEAAHEQAITDRAVAAAAGRLHAGDDCPLCDGTVTDATLAGATSGHTAPPALPPLRAAVQTAMDTLSRTTAAAEAAAEAVEAAQVRLDAAKTTAAGVPPVEEITQMAARYRELKAAAAVAEEAANDADRAADAAQTDAVRLRTAAEAAWTAFDRARDRVGRYDPPPTDRTSLAAACDTLSSWAATTAAARTDRAGELRTQAAAETSRAREAIIAARQLLTDVGLTNVPSGADPRDVLTEEIATARGRADRIRMMAETVTDLRATIAESSRERDVHKAVARHLGSAGFEKWLLEAVLGAVVDSASEIMQSLTSGRYALDLDGGDFIVIDLGRDEARPAASLSGGETFLASVALALALPEQVRLHGRGAAAALETLLIDEGFGSLDGSTLDVVAEAMETLAGSGKSVGVITHVEALASRMPTQLTVTKTPAGSTVTATAA